MADQFTTRTQEALSSAVRAAAGRGNAHVEPVHVLAALLAGLPLAASAACLSDVEAAALVANYLNKKPATTPEGLSEADGACTRAKVNKFLVQQTGAKVVGYKAGLTNPAVQKRFNASAPVWGVLYELDALRAYNKALCATAAEEHS